MSKLTILHRFYSTLFASEPTVAKPDYAKWMLEDPRVNFAISTSGGDHTGNVDVGDPAARRRTAGISHLGIQVDDETELTEVYERLARADRPTVEAKNATCCYHKSDKQWIADPQGVPWETFFTYGEATVYGEGSLAKLREATERAVCCEPSFAEAAPEQATAETCCARPAAPPE